MKNLPNRFIAFIALFVVSTNCLAEFSPASFGDLAAEKSLLTLLKFPDVKGDVTVMMVCAVQALDNGKFKGNVCFFEDFDQPFAGAVYEAASKARLVPAQIDGREKTVYLQYRIKFIKEGEKMQAGLYPNPGVEENVEEYGEEHFAAQRVIGKERWQKACPKSARYRVFAKAHVNEQGVASSISLTHGGGIVPSLSCQDAIIKNIAESQYVPAMTEGVAVPSTFAEPYSN